MKLEEGLFQSDSSADDLEAAGWGEKRHALQLAHSEPQARGPMWDCAWTNGAGGGALLQD